MNFGAGPSKLPSDVLIKLTQSLLQYDKLLGISIVELSHRSPQFQELFQQTTTALRDILNIPKNYEVLLMHGGATTQFAAIPLNITQHKNQTYPYYNVTGYWSQKASLEAKKYFTTLSSIESKSNSSKNICPNNAVYYHYCANETADGFRAPYPENIPQNVPIICDMSSFIFSELIDVSKYDCIYFGAQKNCGISGITVVIIKNNLIDPKPQCPTTLNYKLAADKAKTNNFTVNTPSVISIYALYLMILWTKKKMNPLFPDEHIFAINKQKARMFYEFLDENPKIFATNVPRDPEYPDNALCETRSLTNIVFEFTNPSLNDQFVMEAIKAEIFGIKGHPTKGGLRVSLYNSITLEEVNKLIKFIYKFIENNSNM